MQRGMNHRPHRANDGTPGYVGRDDRHDSLDDGCLGTIGRRWSFSQRATQFRQLPKLFTAIGTRFEMSCSSRSSSATNNRPPPG